MEINVLSIAPEDVARRAATVNAAPGTSNGIGSKSWSPGSSAFGQGWRGENIHGSA
jgi:hypothetical protein